VQGIPLLIFFKDGSEAGRVVGAVPRAQIESAIQRYLGGQAARGTQ
jgi:thioredoxin-like negative regulator of GroEL